MTSNLHSAKNVESNGLDLCHDIELVPFPGSSSTASCSSTSTTNEKDVVHTNQLSLLLGDGAVLHYPSNSIYGLSESSSQPTVTTWYLPSPNDTTRWDGLVSSSHLICACSSSTGEVSLIHNGKIIVTRRILPSSSCTTSRNRLLMGFVTIDDDNMESFGGGDALYLSVEDDVIHLVYNIHIESISSMKFVSIPWRKEHSSNNHNFSTSRSEVHQIRAHFINPNLVQFMVLSNLGQAVVFFQYDLNLQATLETAAVSLSPDEGERICCQVGLSYYKNFLSYVVTNNANDSNSYLQLLHTPSMIQSQKCFLSKIFTTSPMLTNTSLSLINPSYTMTRVLTMVPIPTFHLEEAFALAIATLQVVQKLPQFDRYPPTASTSDQPNGQQPKQFGIHIIQLLKNNNNTLTNVHTLFYIALDYYSFSNSIKLRLTSCSLTAPTTKKLPYNIQMALLYSSRSDPNIDNTTIWHMKCKYFLPTFGSAIGTFHYLIAKQKFQEADTYYWQQQLPPQQWMHPSYVTLAQLSNVLDQGQDGDDEDEIATCLMRLKTAVIAENQQQPSIATACFVQAAILLTSTSQNIFAIEKRKKRILHMVHALSEISTTKRTKSSLYKALKKNLEAYVTTITIAAQVQAPEGMEAVRTTSQLFYTLLSSGHYGKADQVLCLDTQVSKEAIAYAICTISSTIAEKCMNYVIYWISHFIVPHVYSVNDPLWKNICDWSYTVACYSADIATAISILRCITESTSHLEAKVLFSTSWNKQLLSSYSNIYNTSTSSSTSSFLESTHDASFIHQDNIFSDTDRYITPTLLEVSATKKVARRIVLTPKEEGKAAEDDIALKNKIMLCKEKLSQASMLKDARSIGLPNDIFSLSNFEELGGSFYLVVQLLRWCLTSAKMDQLFVSNVIRSQILTFCQKYFINNIDEILEFYAKERLEEAVASFDEISNVSLEKEKKVLLIFHETIYLSNCTSTLKSRGRIILQLLRSGLLFSMLLMRHDDDHIMRLDSLTKDIAQELHYVDPVLSSEVKEAFRLLQIDAILCQYCGREARTWFRVNSTDHMRSLIRHVCRFIDHKQALDHVMTLCDASLASLDKVEAVTDLLCRILLAVETSPATDSTTLESQRVCTKSQQLLSQQCVEIIDVLLRKDPEFALKVATSFLKFAEHMLEECSAILNFATASEEEKSLKEKSRTIVFVSLCIASVFKESEAQGKLPREAVAVTLCYCSFSWASIWSNYRRLHVLQTQYSIYLSAPDLQNQYHLSYSMPRLLQPAISMIKEMQKLTSKETSDSFENIYLEEIDWVVQFKSKLARARRGCTLLCNSESETHQIWWNAIATAACKLLNESGDVACFLLLRLSGLLEENSSVTSLVAREGTSMAILAVAEALFSSASDAIAALRQKNLRMSELESAHSDSDGDAEYFEPVRCNTRESSVFKSMLLIIRSSLLIQQYCLINSPVEKFADTVTMASLIDLISETLVRADSGFGEALERKRRIIYDKTSNLNVDSIPTFQSKAPPLPTLHPTWYVGDGLLLPPFESLILSLEQWKERSCNQYGNITKAACGESIFSNKSWSAHGDLLSLLNSRGAHTLALRLLMLYSVQFVPSRCGRSGNESSVETFVSDQLQSLYQDTVKYLAERSLGGAGAGITSGAIDSNLAAAHLLCLPQKIGFKVYRASLPPAINRRDFDRVMTLSLIGVYAAGGGKISLPSSAGWRNQRTFLAQCQNLASFAFWWSLMKRYRVEFDPGMFENHKEEKVARYAASLLPNLIECLSHTESHCSTVQRICLQYCNAFAIDKTVAASRIVEFYLSPPPNASSLAKGKTSDARHNIVACEEGVKLALPCLPISIRVGLLRRCLIDLERQGDRCGTDYKRYNLILSLYRQELVHLIQMRDEAWSMKALQNELITINRRSEALALLLSFFSESSNIEQESIPSFPSFFTPLSNSIGSQVKPTKVCGVLGMFGEDNGGDVVFDPLAPLQLTLCTHIEHKSLHALAPICSLLGLPGGGYLQARILCQRFLNANEKGLPSPSFDENVLPVLFRLKSAKDCLELAEWCSSRYDFGDKDRLNSLHQAHLYAIKVSGEVESRIQSNSIDVNANEEKLALESVKRIGKMMMALKDFFTVKERLLMRCTSLSPAAKSMILSVLDVTQSKCADNTPPELLVEVLLAETSFMAADASLDKYNDFGIEDFKEVAMRIHDACSRIADEHSHVNTRSIIGILSRRWLVHGDSVTQKNYLNGSQQMGSNPKSEGNIAKEEDSNEFIMDLSNFGHGKGMWSDDIGFSMQDSEKKLSAGEEPFGIKAKGSARELLDYENARASLRIAFVLSFAHHHSDLRSLGSKFTNDEDQSKENHQSHENISTLILTRGIKTKSSQKDGTEYARQLLEVAFTSACRTQLSSGDIFFSDTKTITFAMRHRALRTALILCPNEVIRSVIRDKEYFSALGNEETSFAYHLERCKIASYAAMEIEEMGLPVPHSELVQLSSMNFSSYARALWRHHAESGNVSEFRGRLLGLLIDLCTAQGRQIDDAPLVVSLLNEIVKHRKLPRTTLRAIETIFDSESAAFHLQEIRSASEHLDGEKIVSKALIITAKSLLDELKRNLNFVEGSKIQVNFEDNECYDVLSRLTKLVLKLSSLGVKRISLFTFATELCSIISLLSVPRPNLASWLLSLAIQLSHRVSIEEGQQTLLSKIHDIESSLRNTQK